MQTFSPRLPESEVRPYRHQLRSLFSDRQADLFITINFNQADLSVSRSRHKLQHFHAVVDRALLGKRWQLRERTFFVAVPEVGQNGKIHYHLLLRLPPSTSRTDFRAAIPALCARKVVAGGSIDIRDIEAEKDQRAVAEYMTKASQVNEFILSSEFTRK